MEGGHMMKGMGTVPTSRMSGKRGVKASRKTAGRGSRSILSPVKEQGASLTSARKARGSR